MTLFHVNKWTSKQLTTFIKKNEPDAQIDNWSHQDLEATASEFVPRKNFTIQALHNWLHKNGIKFDPDQKPQKPYLCELVTNYIPPTVSQKLLTVSQKPRTKTIKAEENDEKHSNDENDIALYNMKVRDICSFLIKHKEKGMLKAIEAILKYTNDTYQPKA